MVESNNSHENPIVPPTNQPEKNTPTVEALRKMLAEGRRLEVMNLIGNGINAGLYGEGSLPREFFPVVANVGPGKVENHDGYPVTLLKHFNVFNDINYGEACRIFADDGRSSVVEVFEKRKE